MTTTSLVEPTTITNPASLSLSVSVSSPVSSSSNNNNYSDKYYAIREGKQAKNCIFLSWEDAKYHVSNYDKAEYEMFQVIQDALRYLQSSMRRKKSGGGGGGGVGEGGGAEVGGVR